MDHSSTIFTQLAVVLGLSALLGYVIKSLKLPLLVAYLLVGVLLSLFNIFNLPGSETLTFLPEIGIAFVLFLIGMELDLKEIKNLGKAIIVAGLGQIIFSTVAGTIIAQYLGFSLIESFLLGTSLAFSSTIVVIKMLLDKKDTTSLYGKLVIGIVLLEDLVAILLLMGMTVGTSILGLGWQSSMPLVTLLIKGAILLIFSLGLSQYILEKVFKAVAQSPELLFLSAVAWCFIFVSLSIFMGFSVVIGAFLAGVALANSSFHYEIQGKVRPLRDFFVTIFFVYLGTQVVFQDLQSIWLLIVIFTFYALIFKPFILLLILGSFGFRKHTIFQAALSISQVSEFSLIVMMVALKLGLVSQSAMTAMALTGVISIIASSILISFSKQIYKKVYRFVGFFEHSSAVHKLEFKGGEKLSNHAIVVGGHLMGGEIIKFLEKAKMPFLILDFNPRVIQNMMEQHFNAMYGDIGDPELLDFVNLEEARLIVSTAPSVEDNLTLLNEAKSRHSKAILIVRALAVPDTRILYQAGADYVIMPEVVSGVFMSEILSKHWSKLDYFKDRSKVELDRLTHNYFAKE